MDTGQCAWLAIPPVVLFFWRLARLAPLSLSGSAHLKRLGHFLVAFASCAPVAALGTRTSWPRFTGLLDNAMNGMSKKAAAC